MEERLLEAVESKIQKLANDKEQYEKAIEELSKKMETRDGKLVKTNEMIEYETDFQKISLELESTKKEKDTISELLNRKQELEKSISRKEYLLKEKEQCEKAIKEISDKKVFENGKLVETKEVLEYKKELEKIEEELKIVQEQSEMLKQIDENIKEKMEKYNIKFENKEQVTENEVEEQEQEESEVEEQEQEESEVEEQEQEENEVEEQEQEESEVEEHEQEESEPELSEEEKSDYSEMTMEELRSEYEIVEKEVDVANKKYLEAIENGASSEEIKKLEEEVKKNQLKASKIADKHRLLRQIVQGKEKRENERYNEIIKEAMKEEQIRKKQEKNEAEEQEQEENESENKEQTETKKTYSEMTKEELYAEYSRINAEWREACKNYRVAKENGLNEEELAKLKDEANNKQKEGIELYKILKDKEKGKNIENTEKEKPKEETKDNEQQSEAKKEPKLQKGENRIIDIVITEKEGLIACRNAKGEINRRGIQEVFETKKDKFKRLQINKKCKEIAKNPVSVFFLKRKVNPAIVAVLEHNEEQLTEYISSLYNEKELPFGLVHDLRDTNIVTKLMRNRFTRVESKLGAEVLGSELFNKNKALPPAQKPYKTEERKETIKDKYKQENKDAHIEKEAFEKMQETQEQIAKDVTGELIKRKAKATRDVEKFSGDVIDKEGKVIKNGQGEVSPYNYGYSDSNDGSR